MDIEWAEGWKEGWGGAVGGRGSFADAEGDGINVTAT